MPINIYSVDNHGYFNGKGCTGYYVYGVIKHGSDYQTHVLSTINDDFF